MRVISVEQRAAGEVVSLTGNVQAQTEVNFSFRIDGRMIDRSVNVGDTVKPGQVLARLDPSNEDASLASARAQLASARAQAVEQRNNYNRQKELLAQRFISQAAFDAIAANLQSAESAVKSAQSQVDLASNRQSYTRLVADAGGAVTKVGAEPGEVVPAGRMVVQIARAGGRDAVFNVPAQIKDTRAEEPGDHRRADHRSQGLGEGPRARSVAARRSGDRDVPGARRADRPARRPAARIDGDRQHAHRDRLRDGDPGVRRSSARARSPRYGSWIPRPRPCRSSRSRSPATMRTGSSSPAASSKATSS